MVYSVLVVDDEPNIVQSLEFLMTAAGFEVRVAADGDAALAAVAERKPDLMLLDVMIPGRDGYDVCRSVRANPAWSDLRIIMLTARGRDSEREKGIELGADHYVTKPFSTRELVETVKHYARGEEARGEGAGDEEAGSEDVRGDDPNAARTYTKGNK